MSSSNDERPRDAGLEGSALQTIRPEEVGGVAAEVNSLVQAGDEESARDILSWLHPADIGSVLTAMPRSSAQAVLRVMDPENAVWILQQMHPVQAGHFVARVGTQTFESIMDQVNPGQAVDALRRIWPWHAFHLAGNLHRQLEAPEFMVHQPNTAGTLMISDYPTVKFADRSAEALENLRDLGTVGYKFSNVFAVNEDNTLLGQVSIVDLALTQTDTPVQTLAYPVVASVSALTSMEECARLRLHYNLKELPVVDEQNRLVGVIPGEFLMTATVEQDTNQMLRVNNAGGEDPGGPLLGSIRARLPWLTVNLGTTFLAAATISLFEGILAQVVVLAAFLPVVAGQGGIGGTQTLTLIVRGIALGELTGVSTYRLLAREALLGSLHGLWLGVLVAVIAAFWKQNPVLGVVLGLAILGNMVVAGFVGAAVPLFLRRIGIDPAVASAVIVTTFTDVVGFVLFLGIAAIVISWLV